MRSCSSSQSSSHEETSFSTHYIAVHVNNMEDQERPATVTTQDSTAASVTEVVSFPVSVSPRTTLISRRGETHDPARCLTICTWMEKDEPYLVCHLRAQVTLQDVTRLQIAAMSVQDIVARDARQVELFTKAETAAAEVVGSHQDFGGFNIIVSEYDNPPWAIGQVTIIDGDA